MLLSGYGVFEAPDTVESNIVGYDAAAGTKGTEWINYLGEFGTLQSQHVETGEKGFDRVEKALSQNPGRPFIYDSASGTYAVILAGKDEAGNILVHDPFKPNADSYGKPTAFRELSENIKTAHPNFLGSDKDSQNGAGALDVLKNFYDGAPENMGEFVNAKANPDRDTDLKTLFLAAAKAENDILGDAADKTTVDALNYKILDLDAAKHSKEYMIESLAHETAHNILPASRFGYVF
jgi:hypothetical protein